MYHLSSDPDSLDEEWSNRGCVLNSDLSSSTHSVCECDHLTHFAILLSPGATFSSTHTLALRVIGYVGVSLSVVAMAATIFILAISKLVIKLKKKTVIVSFFSRPDMRSYIHINLCTCLMAAQLLFVIAVDKTGNKVPHRVPTCCCYFHMHTHMAGFMFSDSPSVAVSVFGQLHVDADGRGGPLCVTGGCVHWSQEEEVPHPIHCS